VKKTLQSAFKHC